MSAPSTLRVLIADDHTALRLGLSAIVASMPGAEVVGEAVDGAEAIERYRTLSPDVLTLDLRMPKIDGLDVVGRVLDGDAMARILVMTMYDHEEDISRAIKAGAKGFVLKSASRDEIVEAIGRVASGDSYFPQYVAFKLASHLATAELTPREKDVLGLMRLGLSNKEIGKQLTLTEGTVKTHVREVLSKLGAISRTEAVHLATQRGLLR